MTTRRGERRTRSRKKTARIVSGAVVGLGLGLIVAAIFVEYAVYAVVAGVALGARGKRRRGDAAA